MTGSVACSSARLHLRTYDQFVRHKWGKTKNGREIVWKASVDHVAILFHNHWAFLKMNGACASEYVTVHTILGGSPVILWISLGGKPKWLPLKFGYHDVLHTSPTRFFATKKPAPELHFTELQAYGYKLAAKEERNWPREVHQLHTKDKLSSEHNCTYI